MNAFVDITNLKSDRPAQ